MKKLSLALLSMLGMGCDPQDAAKGHHTVRIKNETSQEVTLSIVGRYRKQAAAKVEPMGVKTPAGEVTETVTHTSLISGRYTDDVIHYYAVFDEEDYHKYTICVEKQTDPFIITHYIYEAGEECMKGEKAEWVPLEKIEE